MFYGPVSNNKALLLLLFQLYQPGKDGLKPILFNNTTFVSFLFNAPLAKTLRIVYDQQTSASAIRLVRYRFVTWVEMVNARHIKEIIIL